MRHLPNDMSRCAGRFGLGPDDPVCERRDSCLRYIALLQQSRDEPIPSCVPVMTGLCADGQDWMIGGLA